MTLLQTLRTGEELDRPVHVTELLDVRDVRLAPQTTADHFVVSERLSSLIIVQLSENAELPEVFTDLFGAWSRDDGAARWWSGAGGVTRRRHFRPGSYVPGPPREEISA